MWLIAEEERGRFDWSVPSLLLSRVAVVLILSFFAYLSRPLPYSLVSLPSEHSSDKKHNNCEALVASLTQTKSSQSVTSGFIEQSGEEKRREGEEGED